MSPTVDELADFGTVQQFDSTNHTFKIVAQRGFASDFLYSADAVSHEDHSACTAAMNERSRIIVREVTTEPLLSSDVRELLLGAKVRSLQATPLIASSRQLVGVVSTYYTSPGGFIPPMWKRVDDIAASFLAEINYGPEK